MHTKPEQFVASATAVPFTVTTPFMQVFDVHERGDFVVLVGTDDYIPAAEFPGPATLRGTQGVLLLAGGARKDIEILDMQFWTGISGRRNVFLKVPPLALAKNELLNAILLVTGDV